jgi:tryptophan synthase alpha chain
MSPVDRLAARFAVCHAEGRAALVGYLTAGDPDPADSESLLQALAAEVDILEIGMPFSDPMADGPVIQAASERALAAGTHMDDVFRLAEAVRKAQPEIGIVLMGYANTPYAMGFERFAERARASGVDGVLLVDIPPEEVSLCRDALKSHSLHQIFLLSPTSTDRRIDLVAENGSGFIYYVSLTGITGAEMGDIGQVRDSVARIQARTDLPVCVGFGIKSPSQAEAVAAFADGVVVGSHFVSQVTAHPGDVGVAGMAIRAAAAAMRKAMAGTVSVAGEMI